MNPKHELVRGAALLLPPIGVNAGPYRVVHMRDANVEDMRVLVGARLAAGLLRACSVTCRRQP